MPKLDDPFEDLLKSVQSLGDENEEDNIYQESSPILARVNSQTAPKPALSLPMHVLRHGVSKISENSADLLDNTFSKVGGCQDQSDDADFSIIDTESNTSYVQCQPY